MIALPASSSVTAKSVERLLVTGQPLKSSTDPSKWPGLSSLRNYILEQHEPTRSKASVLENFSYLKVPRHTGFPDLTQFVTLRSVNRRHLVGLLAQALAATYLGLLVYALHFRDACVLYRLACVRLDSSTWAKVFGGAYRAKPFRPSAPPGSHADASGVGTGSRISASPPPKPTHLPRPQPSRSAGPRDKRRDPASERSTSTGSTISHTSSGVLARERAMATKEVVARLSGPPLDQRTNHRIRLLTHAEATSLLGPHVSRPDANRTDAESATTLLNRPPPPPDEWFVPPQCSILTCLLERPSSENTTPDDPSRVFDSDNSEPPDGYDGYAEALAARKRRASRVARRMQQQHMLNTKREGQRKAKLELRIRLAKRSRFLGFSDDENVDSLSATAEDLYPDLAQQESDMNETCMQTKLEQPPRWILRLLHLDPDFYDVYLQNDQVRMLAESTCSPDSSKPLSDASSGDEIDDALTSVNIGDDLIRTGKPVEVEHQWTNGDSFAWRLMRLGLMLIAKREIDRLTRLLNFGTEDLAVYAPGLVNLTWLLNAWTTGYLSNLNAPPAFTPQTFVREPSDVPDSHLIPPPYFIPDLDPVLTDTHSKRRVSETATLMPSTGATRAMTRLRHLIDPSKTPFQTRDPFSLPAKRLWCHLVRQPIVDDMFTRRVFRRPRVIRCLVIPTLPAPSSPRKNQPTTPHYSSSISASKISTGSLDDSFKPGVPGVGRTTRHSHAHPVYLSSSSNTILLDDALRLIHKEQDPLVAMCVNQVNYGSIVVATPKELVELNIENLVNQPTWLSDEIEYDLELMRKPQPYVYPEGGTDDFVFLNFPTSIGEHTSSAQPGGPGDTASSDGPSSTHVVLKRMLPAVYSLAAHPTLPYYLTGTGTGSLHLYEWGTVMPVVASLSNTYALTPSGATGQYPAGSRGARVTALHFDDSGRRFGCGDADGYFGLWNTQTTVPQKPPYFRCKCHAKGLADFCFVGSSSLIATAGNGGIGGPLLTGTVSSSGQAGNGDTASGISGSFSHGVEQDGANLALWDILLPPARCGVIRFADSEFEAPCTSLAYLAPSVNYSGWPGQSPDHGFTNVPFHLYTAGSCLGSARDRVVVVGTKRGDVCYVDLRKPKVLFSFPAHESAVRALCVDIASDCLITGGADGNIKIWRLSEHELITSFPADFHQGRGAAAVAAAALFRGNQSAAIIAATNPGVSEIRLLPLVTGASLLNQSKLGGGQVGDEFIYEQPQQLKDSIVAASTACRFLSCGADGGLRIRSLVMRPRPFKVC